MSRKNKTSTKGTAFISYKHRIKQVIAGIIVMVAAWSSAARAQSRITVD